MGWRLGSGGWRSGCGRWRRRRRRVRGIVPRRRRRMLPKTRQQRRAEAREKAKELARRDGQRRKAGGQDGHPGAGRELLAEDQMQEIVDHYPEECSGCGREFTEQEKVPRHGPGRHQVAELPADRGVLCRASHPSVAVPGMRQRRTRARLGMVGESAFGPVLQAAVVALTARNRISRRDMSELLSELFGVRISVGAIDAICQRTSLLLAGPHERLASQVLGSGAINVDETGWYLGRRESHDVDGRDRAGGDLPDRRGSPPRPAPGAARPRL